MIVPVDRLFRQLWDEDAVLSLKLTEGLTRLRLRGPNGARDEFLPAATAHNSGALSDSWSRPVVGRGWHLRRHRVRGLNCWSPLTTANRDGYGPAQARLDDSGSTLDGCTPPQPLANTYWLCQCWAPDHAVTIAAIVERPLDPRHASPHFTGNRSSVGSILVPRQDSNRELYEV